MQLHETRIGLPLAISASKNIDTASEWSELSESVT